MTDIKAKIEDAFGLEKVLTSSELSASLGKTITDAELNNLDYHHIETPLGNIYFKERPDFFQFIKYIDSRVKLHFDDGISKPVQLPIEESKLILSLLIYDQLNPGETFENKKLIKATLYGTGIINDSNYHDDKKNIEQIIKRIRHKTHPEIIETEDYVGYRINRKYVNNFKTK